VRRRPTAFVGDAVVEVPDAATGLRAATAARAEGVGVTTLDRYDLGPATVSGLVVGYGHQPPETLRAAGGVLRRAVLGAVGARVGLETSKG
jgi:hypothetical protein